MIDKESEPGAWQRELDQLPKLVTPDERRTKTLLTLNHWQADKIAELLVERDGLQKALDHAEDALLKLRVEYNELLFAVCRKHPGESRHQTALRYIREVESAEVASTYGEMEGEGDE